MSKKEFIMPAGVKKDEAKSTSTYARYEVYPFENGYGQTVGIALRRVLLSSIEGVAITSIRVKGADHEFTSIPGIAEDVTDIIIALKQVLIKTAPVIPEKITISKKGPCTVTAGDFQKDNAVEIVNPDLPIATVSAGHSFELEAEIALGYGFHMARENRPTDQIIGQIPIDSIHSPVTRVNFDAVAHRVGERTDYEKLILDIWTDGRITPDEALHSAAALIRRHFDVFLGAEEAAEPPVIVPVEPIVTEEEKEEKAKEEEAKSPLGIKPEDLKKILAMGVGELELSVRSSNCLNREEIKVVGQLACYTVDQMLNFRNFGAKSLDEIQGKMKALGLTDPSAIPPDILKPYLDMNEAAKEIVAARKAAEEKAKAAAKAEKAKAKGEAKEDAEDEGEEDKA
ncbi:MAG: DNA-directed RNA polymerase subunit alpha [Kiritimatiellae bacterium]|jgi:DNA-directed RNA polymerase subunit alpha|nr:DNA-directed RNA polymerase subunit alpha [Kiritimatiellia bacterium]MBR4612935.1 DNA-directed RNA polymerase subunit alpha [Kiritimatiellia bacterium]